MKNQSHAAIYILILLSALLLLPTLTFANADGDVRYAATNAECMAVIECGSGRLLYAKNPDKRRPMASTTKICTAATVIEHCDNLEKIITVPDKAVGVEGSSVYLQHGENVKIIDLLYGLMLRSGNDCAEALAITVGGSIERFAALMNETARKAGAENSNFVTPHGLHDDNHYTTATDLAKITAYAFRNPIFAQIVETKKYIMPWAGHDCPRVLINKNKILSTYEGGDGVKTGFTKKAGRCLVSSATRNGMRIIAVVLNCGPMFEDCAALMNKAFVEYKMCDLLGDFPECEISVVNGKCDSVEVKPASELIYPLSADEEGECTYKLQPLKELSAPVRKGDYAGNFSIELKNQLLFEGKLYTINSVTERDLSDKIKDLIEAW